MCLVLTLVQVNFWWVSFSILRLMCWYYAGRTQMMFEIFMKLGVDIRFGRGKKVISEVWFMQGLRAPSCFVQLEASWLLSMGLWLFGK